MRQFVVYYATIRWNVDNHKSKLCKGSRETSFRNRYGNHKRSFNVALYKYDIKLLKEYWNLKKKERHQQRKKFRKLVPVSR